MLQRFAVAAVAAVLLVAPSAADAALERHYHGTTPQGYELVITGKPGGAPWSVQLEYKVRCRRHDFWHVETLQHTPYDLKRTRRTFSLLALTIIEPGEVSVELRMSGRRVTPRGRPGSEYWHGALRAQAVLRAPDGSLRERCRTRRMRWRARREGFGAGRWSMTSDPGDYLARGKTLGFDTIAAFGDNRGITVYEPGTGIFRGWQVILAPGRGRRIRAGRTYIDTPEPALASRDAELEVRRPDGGCQGSTGEFTIASVRYDRRGRLRALVARFVHRCGETPDAALRGTIRFRSRR